MKDCYVVNETLKVHSYDWQIKDNFDDDGNVTILSWCLNEESKPYLLRFHNFPAFCYVELPLFLSNRGMNSATKWTNFKAGLVFNSICNKLQDFKPTGFQLQFKEKLYFFRGYKKKFPMLLLRFNTLQAMFECKNKLKYPLRVKGLKGDNIISSVAVKVWETDIPIERKLLTLKDVKYSQWFNIEGVKVQDSDKISHLEHEYVVDWQTMQGIKCDTITHPKIFSFDIETYTDKHNALPDPLASKHVCYMVSVVVQRIMEPETRKTYMILFGQSYDTDLAELIIVKSELELIDKLQDLIVEHDPEIITGYNILGYDNPYLDTRLKRTMGEWKPISRLLDEKVEMKSMSWSSSAYKDQEFNWLAAGGRITVDLLPVIKRDFKLPLYKLDYVANYFLDTGKHEVTAQQMFETYELQACLGDNYDPQIAEIPKCFIDQKEDPEAGIKFKEEELRTMWVDQCKDFALSEMKKVVDYCVVDSDLVLDIFEKIHVWIALIEMSNVVAVAPSALFTRGTQIRSLSQIYDEASRKGIVIDHQTFEKMNIEGGFVFNPTPGIYHCIPCLDFKSLYPTVMIANNIDHRSFVPPELEDKIPDDMCHVIEWDEEVEIEEDSDSEDDENEEKKKKKKEVKTETKHYKYKFVKDADTIIPNLLLRLWKERDEAKAELEKATDPVTKAVFHQKQLQIKLNMNSFYGLFAAQNGGKLPLPQAGAAITSRSRDSTKLMNSYIESKGYSIVYGDSVTGDTPVLIQTREKKDYIEIQNLWDGEWKMENGKEYAEPKNFKVWSDQGFTEIKYIMRHKTKKRLFRITTDTGIVTVTEDHSLLDPNGNKIKPGDVKIRDKLLTKEINSSENKLLTDIFYFNTSQIETAKYFRQLKRIYGNVSLNTRINNKGQTEYIIKSRNDVEPGIIKKIEDLGYVDDYVYDLETENHHFAAGVGEIIVHNTDSTMPDLKLQGMDAKEAWKICDKWAEELTSLFPKPMEVEMENLYDTMLCIKKKNYLCIKIDKKTWKPFPKPEQMKVTGAPPARRDKAKFQIDLYTAVSWKVMKRQQMLAVFNYIVDSVLKLLTRQIKLEDLIIIESVGAHYKSDTYRMKIFKDEMAKIGHPLVPGERIQYLITKTFGIEGKQKLGYKMRTPEVYRDKLNTDEPDHVDYEYYLEKKVMNSIEKQLFQIGYKEELRELEEKYLEADREKLLRDLRKKGYDHIVDELMKKYNGDKEEVIEYLRDKDKVGKLFNIVRPLYSFHIKRRKGRKKRICARVCAEPIGMMLRLMGAKSLYLEEVKSRNGRTKPRKKLKLKIMGKKKVVSKQWQREKIEQIQQIKNKKVIS